MRTASFLESLLKWASVAYALGFLTVLLNTARIGIPALQLLEPVQIWVGIPLAIAFWALIGIAKYFHKLSQRLPSDTELLQRKMEEVQTLMKQGEWTRAAATYASLLFSTAVIMKITGVPWALRLHAKIARWAAGAIAKRFESGLHAGDGLSIDAEAAERGRDAVSFFAVQAFVIADFCGRSILTAAIFVLISNAYIFTGYPKISQKWGGGRPETVRLIVDAEKLPPNSPDLDGFFPHKDPNPINLNETNPLILLFSTEHAYYVRLNNGRVLQLNAEQVEGVIYGK